MKPGKWIIMLVLAIMPALVSAEFYRYVDEQGKVHYTDEFGNVPPDQRPHVDAYEEFQDQVTSQEAETTGQEEVPVAGSGRDVEEEEVTRVGKGTDAGKSDAGEKKSLEEELREVGRELEEEYQALLEERKQLDEASRERMGAAVRAELVEKVRDFNARIRDYEGRREAYNREVEEYNASIAKEAKLPAPEKE